MHQLASFTVPMYRKLIRRSAEVERAREYIESHWMEPFSIIGATKAACLSRAHLIRLFRKHTGTTPYEYYINYKINKLKRPDTGNSR
jgi:transcriptional regulator GlxA family with amidase domain